MNEAITAVAVNILLVESDKEIKQAYISEYSFNHENQEIHLMITNGDDNYYYCYYCINYLHSVRT